MFIRTHLYIWRDARFRSIIRFRWLRRWTIISPSVEFSDIVSSEKTPLKVRSLPPFCFIHSFVRKQLLHISASCMQCGGKCRAHLLHFGLSTHRWHTPPTYPFGSFKLQFVQKPVNKRLIYSLLIICSSTNWFHDLCIRCFNEFLSFVLSSHHFRHHITSLPFVCLFVRSFVCFLIYLFIQYLIKLFIIFS